MLPICPRAQPVGQLGAWHLVSGDTPQALPDTSARVLVQKVIRLALQGDFKSLHYCMERLIPRKKDAPIDFTLRELHDVSDIRKLFFSITAALDEGGITPSEAWTLLDMAEVFGRLLEVTESETRISALEKRAAT